MLVLDIGSLIIDQSEILEGRLLDHFRQVNDTFGHDCDDVALAERAYVVIELMGESGPVDRIGGKVLGALMPRGIEGYA